MIKLCIVLFFFASNCFAQSIELSGFGGIGASTLWGKRFPQENTSPMVGANGGMIIAYNFDKINTIRLEVGYNSKGYVNGVTNNRQYLMISPMAQFHVSEKVRLYFLIGQFTGILLNKGSEDLSFDIGGVVGLGYKQNLYKNRLFIFGEIKEYLGLVNTLPASFGHTNKFDGSIGISYAFNLR